jgi:hypothetical protein
VQGWNAHYHPRDGASMDSESMEPYTWRKGPRVNDEYVFNDGGDPTVDPGKSWEPPIMVNGHEVYKAGLQSLAGVPRPQLELVPVVERQGPEFVSANPQMTMLTCFGTCGAACEVRHSVYTSLSRHSPLCQNSGSAPTARPTTSESLTSNLCRPTAWTTTTHARTTTPHSGSGNTVRRASTWSRLRTTPTRPGAAGIFTGCM